MTTGLIAVMMFASMILLLLTGRQIFLIIGGIAAITAFALWGQGGYKMPFMSAYAFTIWYSLVAIPPFIFMGMTLSRSGVADRLFYALYLWMGGIRGGLGIGTIGLCSLIAAMSGTNMAATVTAGTIALPAMLKRKYNKLIATGTVQAGGALGALIPPSIGFILYGIIASVSIGHLWLAGILPGILLATLYMIYIGIRCARNPELGPPLPPEERAGWGEKFRALRAGIAPIILIFTVLGLLFLGVTSLIECAGIGAVGALVCAAIYRRLSWKMLTKIMDDTLVISSMIMWLVAGALLFSAVYDGLGAIHGVEGILAMAGGGRWGTIIIMQLSFFLMGMVLDDTALLLIVAPLYIPIVANMGFSLVWYGVLYIINMQMAFLTPPFGYNLFLIKGLLPSVAPDSGITMGDLYRSIIPFVGIQAVCLVIIMVFPQIALWIPSLYFTGA